MLHRIISVIYIQYLIFYFFYCERFVSENYNKIEKLSFTVSESQPANWIFIGDRFPAGKLWWNL